jgi:ABC-2 type transport system permease protein
MKLTLIIAKRELTSLFCSPIAYLVIGMFALGTSLIFTIHFAPGARAELRGPFTGLLWLMIFVVPAISMRVISEEFRSGAIELLMTAPLSDTQVIVGKWLGSLAFFGAMLLPVVVMWLVLELYGSPDWGPILSGLLGMMLVGGLYLAIGVFASTITQNQVIAFLVAVFIICLLTIALYFLAQADALWRNLRLALDYMNVHERFEDFNKGVVALNNIIYFVSGIAVFLFMAVKILESRRWR